MMSKSSLLDCLVAESRRRQQIHPHLKRMVLAAAQTALKQVTPDDYFRKCHGAAAAIFMILNTLRIRSNIFGGTVSWLYGGVDANGTEWQSRCGFWSHNPGLPTPHAWVVTEFNSLIDLTCAYFHQTHGSAQKGFQSYDVLPMIWMQTEHLQQLPSLTYTATAQFDSVNLEHCDEPARRVIGDALAAFWGQPWITAMVETNDDLEAALKKIRLPEVDNATILDGQNIESLRAINAWVARNSAVPTASTLTMSPGLSQTPR